ncbi:hypothetical protein IGB42_03344 [Andreprevotia sp. IGB-42]|uniref:hypothetical protein n=1 Tax=Andreprevotia sp. IGB-42 TaxID=2497473 RepID=UPI00135AD1C7|nr:hypothetical protein [Andreprevotia sp. IGB-42]KAF0812067.1 hypothetical protein IGB42_03344 [Andreprevotia sp. IGB-42]
MRQIIKPDAPGVLTGNGAAFQNAARQFALTGRTDNDTYKANLKKHALYRKGRGKVFQRYASKLFSTYSYYSDPAAKQRLIVAHHGKCAFCESFIMDTDVGDVEHFRPKAEVTRVDPDDARAEITLDDHPGYFWLSADWGNLFLSCKQCNQAYKRNLFDVWPDTPRATPANPTQAEEHLLLDPASTDALLRQLIRYDPRTAEALANPIELFGELAHDVARHIPRIARTIGTVGLNRPRLKEARARHLVKLRAFFIMVANHGGLPQGHAAPALTDTRPAILDFIVQESTAEQDALSALLEAVNPRAEYSALALDALIVWSQQLRFQTTLTPVALHSVNHITLLAVKERFRPQLDLAETIRAENAASSADESQPDTRDLDISYNKLLDAYRKLTKEIGPKAKKLAQLRDKVAAARAKHQEERDAGPLPGAEDRYQELKSQLQDLLLKAGLLEEDEVPLDMPVQTRLENLRLAGADFSQAEQPKFDNVVRELLVAEEAFSKDPLLLQAMKKDLYRLTVIIDLEAPLDAYHTRIFSMNEDLTELQTGYENCGSRAERLNRCRLFATALDDLQTWLESDGAVPSDDLKHHLAGKGYPPGVRK